MAARENQGYLIAVIILVLLTLILALAAFLGISKAGEHSASKDATEQKLLFSNKESEALEIEILILKAYLGDLGVSVGEVEPQIQSLKGLGASNQLNAGQKSSIQQIVDEVEAIKSGYTKDMVGSVTTPEGEAAAPTWRSKLASLKSLVAKKVYDNAQQVRLTAISEAEAATKIKEMESAVTAMQTALADTKAEMAENSRTSSETEKVLNGALQEATDLNEIVNVAKQTLEAKTSKAIRELEDDIGKVEKKNSSLKERINVYEREVFDRPDGQIVRVAARSRSCTINLGSADGLTINRTFSIYDKSVTNFDKGEHKAKIEVTSVDLFSAKANITEEDPNNPILSGDHILTATWDPGFSVSIALTGVFDLDGDRYDDRDKLAKMIVRNGGKIAATHDDEGNITGKIGPTVRYLVVGNSPSILEDANDNVKRSSSAINDAMRDMQEEARKNTVEPIGLQKLLNRMGVRATPKTLQIKRRVGAFPTRASSDAAKKN